MSEPTKQRCRNHDKDCCVCGRCRKELNEINKRLDELDRIIAEKIRVSYAGHPAYQKKSQ